ncbi:hypothetical protein ACFLTR_01120 [Chloroflexota bacterium]
MSRVKWLVYILSFFLPVFGFVTFWVFAGREGELSDVARNSMLASFIGVVLLAILAAVGVTMFDIPWGSPVG